MFDDDNGYPTVTFAPIAGVRYCECGQVRDRETDTCFSCEGGAVAFVPTAKHEPTQEERRRFYDLFQATHFDDDDGRWE